MGPIEPLRATYLEARAAFGDAARAAGARVSSHVHPGQGPEGEELAVDLASLGPDDATDLVLVVSGTHGVEGYCGSALQTQWLRTCRHERPEGTRVVMLHGFNPYGFAWVRRVNEDNVDLNRNFVDWTGMPPANPEYDGIADLVVPADWSKAEQQRTTLELLTIAEERGWEHLQTVISSGQYSQPTGVFYGGREPVWSHSLLLDVVATELASCQRLTIIDLHSGLGPWGHGELIVHEPVGSPGYDRARATWGEVRSMQSGESVSAVLQGDWLAAIPGLVADSEVTAAALEFGTVDIVTVMQALRADAWLHAHGDPLGAEAPAIRAQVRAAFADDGPGWIATLWERFAAVMRASLGLPARA
ncbi:MAG: DUF2817 domain-containing protein [Ilumatobacteraceae bacterium]